MAFDVVIRFLLETFRFLAGSAVWCAVMQMANAAFGVAPTAYVIPPTRIARNPIHYVAATDAGTFVVSFGVATGRDRAFYREIAKIDAGMDEPVKVRIPITERSTWTVDALSDGFVATATDWWYATLDDRDGAAATTFVKSDGSRATYARPPAPAYTPDTNDRTHSNSWHTIVIPGEKPRAIELTYRADGTIVREVDWDGTSRSWELPPVNYKRLIRIVAQPLPDGRIALLSDADGMVLYLLANEGRVETVPLRNLRIQQFDAAVDSTGRIGIVTARNANAALSNDTGTIDAAIIDPAHPDSAEWSALRHDVRVTGTSREVQVVATPEGFAAAWINEIDGKHIEAAGIDARGHGGPVVEIGRTGSRADTFIGVQAKHDELFFWWDDGQHLLQRRLPASLNGYSLLQDLAQHLCGEAEVHH
jgi:hypothetical protein